MKKILTIAWKDLLVTWRDKSALLLMLATPFALTLAMGFALGGLGSSQSSGPSQIPVAIVNLDRGPLGQSLVEAFQSDDLADLVEPTILSSAAEGQEQVDRDLAAAAVIIPAGFSDAILPAGEAPASPPEPARVSLYANPSRPVGTSVTRAIVDQILSVMNGAAAGGRVTVELLLESGRIDPSQAQAVGQEAGHLASESTQNQTLIHLVSRDEAGQDSSEAPFDWGAYMAPSMAILFLMFTVTAGGRAMLAEREAGTLPRMLVSPSSSLQVLGGKVLGIYLIGLTQLSVLALASRLLMGVGWGAFLPVSVLILALVFAASGWGVLLAAFARTPAQASAAGSALALVFGVGSGNFFPRELMPAWLQAFSRITPNAWGLEGFGLLTHGGTLGDIQLNVLALAGMGLVLFAIALPVFRRQYAA